MKKEMVLRPVSSGSEKYEVSRPSAFSAWKHAVLHSAPLLFLSRFYGRLLDMPVSPLQAFHLTHAQIAFFLMVFPLDMSVVVRLLFTVWFGLTVLHGRRAGLK